MNFSSFLDLIGFSGQSTSHREKVISTVGGFLGVFAIFISSFWFLDPDVAVLIVPSMGATAVLLFAAPHAQFSQPWNVIAGHSFSAIIGVACWQLIPDYKLAASISVGMAIGVMVATRSVHPPGGATALAAVIGSEKLHNLGYLYEFQPILLNSFTIVIVAVIFNSLFPWRQYPTHIHNKKQILKSKVKANKRVYAAINHEDFVSALSQIETFVDIEEADLLKIYEIATNRHVHGSKEHV